MSTDNHEIRSSPPFLMKEPSLKMCRAKDLKKKSRLSDSSRVQNIRSFILTIVLRSGWNSRCFVRTLRHEPAGLSLLSGFSRRPWYIPRPNVRTRAPAKVYFGTQMSGFLGGPDPASKAKITPNVWILALASLSRVLRKSGPGVRNAD